jgi:[ribosomal protein S5]-alanine N-acetyltransferase
VLGPILEGERIRLEPPRPEVLPTYLRWFEDTEITRYLMHRLPFTDKQGQDWLEASSRDELKVVWDIVLKENDKLIGATSLEKINWRNRHAESGIMIGAKDEWGKGYATEAMRLRTRYAFRHLGLEKVFTFVIEPNDASRRALERAGYKQCGVWRRHFFAEGRWHDAWLGEVLRDEWEATQP